MGCGVVVVGGGGGLSDAYFSEGREHINRYIETERERDPPPPVNFFLNSKARVSEGTATVFVLWWLCLVNKCLV